MQHDGVTVVILCGGRGLRAWPATQATPKPLLAIGGRPLLAHLMEMFALQGISRFVLAAGYKAELIESFAGSLPASWRVDISNAGLQAGTAERVNHCSGLVGKQFIVTYGDCLAEIGVSDLLRFHTEHGRTATVTAVPYRCPFGLMDVDSASMVLKFSEKPVMKGYPRNGGFLVFQRGVFDKISGPSLEEDTLPELAACGEVFAYNHKGFWCSIDTYKDLEEVRVQHSRFGFPWIGKGSVGISSLSIPTGRPAATSVVGATLGPP